MGVLREHRRFRERLAVLRGDRFSTNIFPLLAEQQPGVSIHKANQVEPTFVPLNHATVMDRHPGPA